MRRLIRRTAVAATAVPPGVDAAAKVRPVAASSLLRAVALVTVSLAVVLRPSPAQEATPAEASESGPLTVLDVPFVAQTEALCGAAALAMVLRYWGERGVRAADFAHLLTADGRGIATGRLAREAARSGWRPLVFEGDLVELRRQVERGRPVIALLEVAPDRYHYVVVVASWSGGTAFHDPARAPWRVESGAAFLRSWEGAGRWAMVLVPREGAAASPAPGHPPARVDSAAHGCASAVEAAVKLTRQDRFEEADALLRAAAAACPSSPAPGRELAGLRLRQGRFSSAAAAATRVLRRDASDLHARRILATARYLEGSTDAALAAWGRSGDASLDLVRISGLVRTRHRPVADLMGLEPGRPLSPAGLRTARRRLASLPVAAGTRVDYRPVGGGAVELRAAVLERPLAPITPVEVVGLALRAVANGELAATAAGPTGAGEAWHVAWRPSPTRPRFELGVELPGRLGVPGVWHLSGSRERERWATPPDASGPREPGHEEGGRRRLELGFASWLNSWLRWEGGVGLERWSRSAGRRSRERETAPEGEERAFDGGTHGAVSGGLEARDAPDRIAAALSATVWHGLAGAADAVRVQLGLRWRSRPESRGIVLAARGDGVAVSAGAPLFLWPGAGTGRGRTPPLRAHPMLRDGTVTGPAFGPRLAAASVEAVHWMRVPGLLSALPLRVGVAGFADAARAWRAEAASPFLLDLGAGLRLAPGNGGRLRLDLARGAVDGAAAVSLAWETAWPGL